MSRYIIHFVFKMQNVTHPKKHKLTRTRREHCSPLVLVNQSKQEKGEVRGAGGKVVTLKRGVIKKIRRFMPFQCI